MKVLNTTEQEPQSPTVLDRCKSLLDAQTAKGVNKYGGALDVTRPSAIETADHAAEEAADKLQYSVWLAQIVREELAEKERDRKQLISEFAADGARLSARIAELETQRAENARQAVAIESLNLRRTASEERWAQECEGLKAAIAAKDSALRAVYRDNQAGILASNHLLDRITAALSPGAGTGWLPANEAEKLRAELAELRAALEYASRASNSPADIQAFAEVLRGNGGNWSAIDAARAGEEGACSTCDGAGSVGPTGQTPESFSYGEPCPDCNRNGGAA